MKISVVTNAFNQGKYLAAAAESVLSQAENLPEGSEIEYWIVDPGSSDSTAHVLKRLSQVYPGKFSVLSEPDDGPADGLNRAFARASGDWFIYLNADDVFLPGAFGQMVNCAGTNPEAAAILGNGYIVGEGGQYMRRAISTRFTARRFVQGTAFALQQSTFYRADAFRRVGGFNTENTTSWDAELLVDLDRAGFELVNADGYWSLFRMQPNSITVSQRFAEESAQTHRRYFREEMGRERRTNDLYIRRLRQIGQRISNPISTAARIRDALVPPKRIFHEALPPEWDSAS